MYRQYSTDHEKRLFPEEKQRQIHQQLRSEEIYHGQFINLRIQPVSQPSGGTSRFEVVEHPAGVAIVALRYNSTVTDERNIEPEVVLVYQKRPAIGKHLWEIPAGMVEAHERHMPELAAARELREETGYVANDWICLVREYPSPGFSTETLTIYLAQQVHPASDAPSDPTEIDQVRWLPLSEALAWCRNGEIQDGKTLLSLYLAHYMFSQ